MFTRHKKTILISVLSCLLILLSVAVTLFTYQRAFAGKIYKNVYFADLDLSGKTRVEAVDILNEKLSGIMDDQLTISGNNKSITTKVGDTGLSFDISEIVDRGYRLGRSGSFFQDLKTSFLSFFKKNDLAVTPSLNQTRYDNFLEIAIDQLNTDPINAALSVVNGQITTIEATDGQEVDTTNMIDKIIENLGKNVLTIDLTSKVTPATIKSTDFATARATAGQYLSKDITFTYTDKAYKPTRADIGSWIEFGQNNGQHYASLNDTNIKAYLNKIAANFQITRVDRKVNNADGAVIQEGRPGLYLNKDLALSDLKAGINDAKIVVAMTTYTEVPKEIRVTTVEGFVPGRFPGKYIDIDLSSQKLCRVEGNTLIDCFVISSGKPGMDTPTGTFAVNDKSPRHWSNKYSMWLPWWQQFKEGGWGMHELPETDTWKETAEHLGTPVSHGCVRLGVGPAETVYNWSEMGTPVYIHK